MSYLVKETLQPRLFILACNVDAVVIQSTNEEAKLSFVNNNATAQNSIYPNFSISSSNELFKFYKDSNVISSYRYINNEAIQTTDITHIKQVEFQEGQGVFTLGPGIGYCNDTLLIQLSTETQSFQVQNKSDNQSKLLLSSTYHIANSEARLGIGISNPTQALHVIGDILATGTLTASNLVVLGDTVILDTVTSNTEQLVVTNLGSGPALKVTQEGTNTIAEFYDDANLALIIADGGLVGIQTSFPRQTFDVNGISIFSDNVGIGTTIPKELLDVYGNAKISGNLGIGNVFITGELYKNDILVNLASITDAWVLDNATCNLYFTTANVGIGTTIPKQKLHVYGETLLEGTIITNSNNIDAGTGTISASLFSGTATQVSQTLTRGNYLTGNNYNGSSAITWDVDGTTSATANKVVVRDVDANIYAGNIGIGTTTVRASLDVVGGAFISNSVGVGTDTNNSKLAIYNDSTTIPSLSIYTSNGTNPFIIDSKGNVGIGTLSSRTRLSISPSTLESKITLWDGSSSTNHYGFGISVNQLNFHVDAITADHVFYAGGKNGDGTELIRIMGRGNIGIGTTFARAALDIQKGSAIVTGNIGIGTTQPLYHLHVEGISYLNGLLNTNSNNIDAGTGTIKASLFSGTAIQVSQILTRGSYLTGNNYNGSVATTWTVDATTNASANTVVARDVNSNIYVGNVGLGTTIARERLDIVGKVLLSGNIGIGTDIPFSPLTLYTNSLEPKLLTVYDNTQTQEYDKYVLAVNTGNIGIGTNIPQARLDIRTGASGRTAVMIQQLDATSVAIKLKGTSSLQTGNIVEVDSLNSGTPNLVIDKHANLGIGTTAPRQKLEIQGNTYINGNIGIGTLNSRYPLDIIGTAIISTNIGIATNIVRQPLDVIGNTIISANLGIATTSPQANLHIASAIPTVKLDGDINGNLININDNSYLRVGSDQLYKTHVLVVGDTYSGGTGGRINLRYKNYIGLDVVNGVSGTGVEKVRIDNIGNVGIGTTAPRQVLEVQGVAYISGNIGINTVNPSEALYVNGNIATNNRLISTVSTGISPLSVSSTTVVNNLNVQYLEGQTSSFYRNVNNINAGTLVVSYGGTGCNILPAYKLLVGNADSPLTTPWELHWQNGNLGIGTNQPASTLDVIGAIKTSSTFISTVLTGIAPLSVSSTSFVSNLNVQLLNSQNGNYYTNVDNVNNGILSVAYGGTGSNYLSTNKLLVGRGYNSIYSPIELHWDGRQLGIGTTLPRQRLDLDNGNLIAGNIGIGTTVPTQALEVLGMTLTQSIGINTSYARKTVDIIGDIIQQGNLGIGTASSHYAVQVYSSESVFTIHQGKVGISKGAAISPTTDLEIRNSSTTEDYTGVLLTNNGNVYPNASLRIQGHRYDNTSNLAYTANMGLLRYNNNTALIKDTPLGLIHFGGNHTSGSSANRAYSAYIGAIADEDFTTSSNMRTSIIFKTGSNAYNYYDTSIIHKNESMRINADGNVGIGTTQPSLKFNVEGNAGVSGKIVIGSNTTPNAALEIYSTDAMLIPKGTTNERPTEAELGYIRYNTDYKQFEGFAENDRWQALEGVKSIQGDTYIIAEYTAGNDDKGLHFYTSNVEQLILDLHGNLGLGTTLPQQRLDVNGISYFRGNVGIGTVIPIKPLHVENEAYFKGRVGMGTTFARAALEVQPDIKTTILYTDNFYTSNLTVTGSYFVQDDNQYIRNTLQLNPLRITQQVQNSSTCNFVGIYNGLYKAIPEATEVYVNGYKMAYSSSSNKDYDITYELDSVNLYSIFTVSLIDYPKYGDIVDITIWPQYLDPDGMLKPGYILQNIQYSYWNKSTYSSNLYYTSGNVGIGTNDPIYPLEVATSAYIKTLETSNIITEKYIIAGQKIGIQTSIPYTSLDIRATDAILLPKGTTAERPSGMQGFIRYNTETTQFEGLGAADQWGSLGGVKSTDQQTYISAELSPGTNDGNLRFYNQNNLNMIITYNGNVGIGNAVPIEKLHVEGNIYSTGTIIASNLRVVGDFVTMNTLTSNTEQLVINNDGTGPALKVLQSGNNTVAEFYDKESGLALIIDNNGNVGIGSTQPSRLLDIGGGVYLNGVLTTNNCNINAGSGTITANTFSGTATQVSQTLTRGSYLTGNNYNGSLATTWAVDGTPIAIIDKVVVRDSLGNIYVSNIGIGTATTRQALDVYGNMYLFGNIGLGTSNIELGKLVVAGNIVPSACNVYDLGTSNLRFRDIYLSGKSIDLGGTRITRDDITKGLNISDEYGRLVDTSISTVYASNIYVFGIGNIGIGTNYARQKLDVIGSIISSTSIGIGTTVPRKTLDIQGDSIVSGNIGIGTTSTNVILELHSTNSLLLPKGTSIQRPTGVQGYIRYNTESIQFEGFGAGNTWGSLGGVKSVLGDTYILAEYSPGNNDKSLHFYTSNIERMTLTSNGNLGIGTTNPRAKLEVIGDVYTDYRIITSNLTVLGNLEFGAGTSTLRNNLQINPVRKIIYVSTDTSNNFNIIANGTFGGYASNVQIFKNRSLLTYYSDTVKDYDVLVSYTDSITIYGVSLTTPAVFGDIIDITVWPQIIQQSAAEPGYVYQQIQIITDTNFITTGNDIIYTTGNIGIGTLIPTQKLHVEGNIFAKGTITCSNLSVIGDFTTLNTITSNTEQLVIENAGTGPALQVTQTGNNSVAEFYDKESGIAMYIGNNGNIGIGTVISTEKLYVEGNIFAKGTITCSNVGTGPALKVTQTGTQPIADFYDNGTALAMRIANGGNVGIGTTVPQSLLHVFGSSNTNALTLGSATMAVPTGSMPMFVCRAWVNFDGTLASGYKAAGNVASVVRGTTGVYTITFTTAMTSTNYACIVTFDGGSTSVVTSQPLITKNTTNVVISCFRAETGASTIRLAYNSTDVNVSIFL